MKRNEEYATTSVQEMRELRRCGIRYTFVKVIDEVTVWKYEKTPQLFEVLRDFYSRESHI